MKKTPELVFVPVAGAGHLTSTVEAAQLLLDRDDRISVTILIMPRSNAKFNVSDRLRFIDIPETDQDSGFKGMNFMEKYKPHIREAVSERASRDDSLLAGLVLDMFCTTFMDIANEFGVPSYIFFTSGAAFLGFMFHFAALVDQNEVDPEQLKNSHLELAVPCFANPIPSRVLPTVCIEKEYLGYFFDMSRRFSEAKGVLVNSFAELEPAAMKSFSEGTIGAPPVYPIGPILNLKGTEEARSDGDSKEIMEWLDDQSPSSVVFLCFGSMGGVPEEQAKEIAFALERSGVRFLWSLRRAAPAGILSNSTDYQNVEQVVPEGFLERTAGVGKVIGWAPQVAVLGHPSVGGFVSHCGWNSTLESIWHGVPIATWPMYSEQQLNAFQLVREVGLAEEITLDYRRESPTTVRADDIERGIRRLMEPQSEVRTKVKVISEKGRRALLEDGSSSASLRQFVQHVIHNMP